MVHRLGVRNLTAETLPSQRCLLFVLSFCHVIIFTFRSVHFSLRSECYRCKSECSKKLQEITRECTPTTDAVCDCIAGHWLRSKYAVSCEKHQACPPGEGVVTNGEYLLYQEYSCIETRSIIALELSPQKTVRRST